MNNTRVLVLGAGAIGATVAAWMAAQGVDVTVLDVGEVAAALRQSGITTYEMGDPERTRRTVRVRVAESLGDCADAHIVVLAVKNYSLPDVAQQLREQLGDRPVIVSMANGRENQEILPKFFSRVIYCVVGYNARCDQPAVVGYQRRGPLLIGTPHNTLQAELHKVQEVLARGCRTEIVDRLQDAVHTKLVVNLTNALDALVGRGYRPISSFSIYQRLLSHSLWEGVRVVRAAGFHEYRIAGAPSFTQIHLAATLPGWLTRPLFRRKMRVLVMTSMTQDVALRGASQTELESITGYFLRLASAVRLPVPYNEAIYRLGKENFHPGFQPLRCEAVLNAVRAAEKGAARRDTTGAEEREVDEKRGGSMPDQPSGAQALVRTLADAGVTVCFANPGTSEMHFVAALDEEPRMRAVLVLFEGVATGAADGYARMAGKPAVTLLHLGCGLGNGLANLHNARKGKVPVVNIVGDHATYHAKYDAQLQSDIATVARNVSRWVRTSSTSSALCQDAVEAIAAAVGPPGQVATLILPADVSWSGMGAPKPPPVIPAPVCAADEHVSDIARVLAGSGRRALLLGNRALREPALTVAAQIASQTGAKLFAETFPTRMERGAGLPHAERLAYLAELASAQLAGYEHLILIDAKAPVSFFAYPGQKSYLVPEGCEVHELFSAEQDAEGSLRRLCARLGAQAANPPLQAAIRPSRPRGKLTAEKVSKAIGHLLPERAILVDESNTSGLMLPLYTAGAPRHDLLTLTGGAIGQGLPNAVGAAIACPDRPVLALVGDGSAMYTIQSLWTMAREQLNVTSVVFNNRSYAILNVELQRVRARGAGEKARSLLDLGNPRLDFVELAQGMGVQATRASTADELVSALTHALQTGGPHLIEAVVPNALSGIRLKLLPYVLSSLADLPRPMARLVKRKIAP